MSCDFIVVSPCVNYQTTKVKGRLAEQSTWRSWGIRVRFMLLQWTVRTQILAVQRKSTFGLYYTFMVLPYSLTAFIMPYPYIFTTKIGYKQTTQQSRLWNTFTSYSKLHNHGSSCRACWLMRLLGNQTLLFGGTSCHGEFTRFPYSSSVSSWSASMSSASLSSSSSGASGSTPCTWEFNTDCVYYLCSSGVFRNRVNKAETKQLNIGVASQHDIYGSETADLHLFLQALQSFLCSFILWVYPEMPSGVCTG